MMGKRLRPFRRPLKHIFLHGKEAVSQRNLLSKSIQSRTQILFNPVKWIGRGLEEILALAAGQTLQAISWLKRMKTV